VKGVCIFVHLFVHLFLCSVSVFTGAVLRGQRRPEVCPQRKFFVSVTGHQWWKFKSLDVGFMSKTAYFNLCQTKFFRWLTSFWSLSLPPLPSPPPKSGGAKLPLALCIFTLLRWLMLNMIVVLHCRHFIDSVWTDNDQFYLNRLVWVETLNTQ